MFDYHTLEWIQRVDWRCAMMDIGAVCVENMMVLLLQLCVDNLDTLQQVNGYTKKTTLVF